MTPDTLPDHTLPQLLRQRAQQHPQRVAIRQKDFGIWADITWRDYYQRACHFGMGLRRLGLSPGAHVGILSENRLEWVLAQMGCGLVGMVAVGVYPTSPTPEVSYVLAHADVALAICEDQEQTDKVLEALPELPRMQHIVVIDTKGLRNSRAAHPIQSFADIEQLGARHAHEDAGLVDQALAAQTLDDIALMIYTSGSTGRPKGAMISYRNIRGVVPGIVERLRMNQDTTHLSYLPLCHVAEQMLTTFAPITIGSTVGFGESIRTVQEDLREIAPTIFLGVPRIWEKMHSAISIKIGESGPLQRWLYDRALAACTPFAARSAAQRSLTQRLTYHGWYWIILRALHNFIGLRRTQVALTGAAPISPSVVQFFRTLGIPLIEVYGLTESTGMITGQSTEQVAIGSVGTPILGMTHRLDPATNELLIQGDMVFAGYYKNPEATADVIRDGWLHTGDIAQERDGQLHIVDRMKDIMITAGGKNLTPSEIEKAMKGSPYIKECVVVADGRKFVSALIQIEFDNVAKWAEGQRIAFTHFRSLAEHPQVRALIESQVAQGNTQLAPVSQIRRFHLLTKELDHDDGEVTATMKVRRSSIVKAYAADIEAMYA